MYCRKCGLKINYGEQVCRDCGEPTESAEQCGGYWGLLGDNVKTVSDTPANTPVNTPANTPVDTPVNNSASDGYVPGYGNYTVGGKKAFTNAPGQGQNAYDAALSKEVDKLNQQNRKLKSELDSTKEQLDKNNLFMKILICAAAFFLGLTVVLAISLISKNKDGEPKKIEFTTEEKTKEITTKEKTETTTEATTEATTEKPTTATTTDATTKNTEATTEEATTETKENEKNTEEIPTGESKENNQPEFFASISDTSLSSEDAFVEWEAVGKETKYTLNIPCDETSDKNYDNALYYAYYNENEKKCEKIDEIKVKRDDNNVVSGEFSIKDKESSKIIVISDKKEDLEKISDIDKLSKIKVKNK